MLPTLINAAPALSMELTRNPYHQSVPLLSLSRFGFLLPIHMTGMVRMTGTKMKTRWRNRKPVAMGSMIQ